MAECAAVPILFVIFRHLFFIWYFKKVVLCDCDLFFVTSYTVDSRYLDLAYLK